MPEMRTNPYIWVTWLTKLMVGENSCEWAAWFRAQYESWSWEKVPGDFDVTNWQIKHTALVGQIRDQLEREGKTVFEENQNSFTLRGRTATLGGKPDLITSSGGSGTIIDAKTGRPSPSHHIQVMVYMYAVPRTLRQYEGLMFDGKVVYDDHEVLIPNTAVDETFTSNLTELIERIASGSPARKVPSEMECGFCNIPSSECPERLGGDTMQEAETTDF